MDQVALGLVETGQFSITGTVFIIHQIALFLGKVAGFEVKFGLFDALEIVGMSRTHFADNCEPLSGHTVISNGKVGLILTDAVVTGKAVEHGPAGGQTIAERGVVAVIVSIVIILVVRVTVETGFVTEIGKRGGRGRIAAVSGIHLIAADFQLFAEGFQVRTVGQRGVQINIHGGEIFKTALDLSGKAQIGGKCSIRISHQNGQCINGRFILVFSSDHAHIGVVHQNLEVEHIAQGNSTGIKFVLGIFQRGHLELAVLFGNTAVFDGQKNFVVSVGHSAHQQTAGIGLKVFLVIDIVLGGHPVELTGKSVKEQQIGADAGAGRERIHALGMVSVTVIALIHLMGGPAVAVVHGKIRADGGRVGSQSLIVFGAGGVDGKCR